MHSCDDTSRRLDLEDEKKGWKMGRRRKGLAPLGWIAAY
jgi:hypothetical protein